MPKKRPFFEYKGLQGLIDSINKATDPKSPHLSYDPPYPDDSVPPSRSRHHRHHHSSRHPHSRSRKSPPQEQRRRQTQELRTTNPNRLPSKRTQQKTESKGIDESPIPSPEKRYSRPPSAPATPAILSPTAHSQDQRYQNYSEQPTYPQPGDVVESSNHLLPAASAIAAAAAAAKATSLAAETAAQSNTSVGKRLPQSMAHSKGAYSEVGGTNMDDDGKSENLPPSNMSGDDGVSHVNNQNPAQSSRYSQNQEPKSIPGRIKEGVLGLLPRRGRDKPPIQDDSYMSVGKSRISTANPSGTKLNGSQAALSEAVTRPAPVEPPKSKAAVEQEKQNRTLWRAARLIGVIGAAIVGGKAIKNYFTKSKDKKKKGSSSRDSDDYPDDDYDSDDSRHHRKGHDHRRKDRKNALRLSPPKGPRFGGFISVPQGESYIIERSGKFNRNVTGGSTFLFPFRDHVAYRHSLKEIGLSLDPYDREIECFTREGIPLGIIARMFIRIEDPIEASYGVEDLQTSILMIGMSSMKKEISKMGVKDLFTKHDAMCERISSKMNQASRPWGVRCISFDILDKFLLEEMRDIMEREVKAERMKHADILQSEGQRQALINKADAEMQAQMRISQARQMDIVNQAIGEAHAIQERGEAIASAMRDVAQVVNEPGGEQAMRLRLAEQYLEACVRANNGEGHQDPAQVAEAMNNAFGLLNTLGDPNANVVNPFVAPHQRQGNNQNGGPGPSVPPGTMPGPPPTMPNQHHHERYQQQQYHHQQQQQHNHYMNEGNDDSDNEIVDEEDDTMLPGEHQMRQGIVENHRVHDDEEDDSFERQMIDDDRRISRPDDRETAHMHRSIEAMQRRPVDRDQYRRTGQGATYVDDRFSESSAEYEAQMISLDKRKPFRMSKVPPRPTGGAQPRRRVTIASDM